MKKIAIITANMGNFDNPMEYAKQSVGYDFYRFTDENFHPRWRSMMPRLQARIPKMFGWQMVPLYDYYIWVDASFSLLHPDSVKWFMEQCDGFDIAVLKHPMRNSIQEEADYLKKRLREEKNGKKSDPYVTLRYENELIDEQLAEIKNDEKFVDDRLFASTAFIYKNTDKNQKMLKEWWYHTSRYHSVDQLSFPYVLDKSGCAVNIIPTQKHHDFHIPYLTLVRYRSVERRHLSQK